MVSKATPRSTVTPLIVAAGPGAGVSGYDTLPVTQAQVTFIRFFYQVLGANRLSVAAEVGANWVGSLPDQSEQRYGRSPTFGVGSFTPIPLAALGIPLPGELACDQPFIPPPGFEDILPTIVPNTNVRNCTNDGYVTDSSWGYRIRAAATYNDVFAGINLTPNLAWSHDVDGYSPNSNFTEDAKALSVGIRGDYLNRYTGSLSYTTYFDGDYNTIVDRDFLSLSLSVSF